MRYVDVANRREESIEGRLTEHAVRQHGVLTRAQVEKSGATFGLIHHRIRTGAWQRVAPGVYRIAAYPSSWRQRLMIACAIWGEGTVVSHRAAAALWRFLGFDIELVELTVPTKRKRKHGPGTIHRGLLLPRDVTVVDGIPVTVPARTLYDITSIAPQPLVEEALDDALHRRIVTVTALRRRLDNVSKRGRPGVVALRSLLEARNPSAEVPQSVFETRLLRLLVRGKVPAPILQHPVHDERGLVGMIDFAWPDRRLAIEADGFRWHSARTRFEHDRTRRNRLTLSGWRVIHVTWTDLTRRPEAVLIAIRKAVAG